MRCSQRTKPSVSLGVRFKFVSLLSLVLLSLLLIISGEAYAAAVFATNAGGPAYMATDGTNYQTDTFFSGGLVYGVPGATITGTTDPILYETERYGNTFSYSIPLPNGTYTVILKFAEIYWNQAGQRIFNVFVQGVQVGSNLDVFASAGGIDKAYDVPIPNVNVTSGILNISFQAVKDNAIVGAIEVVPQYRPLSGASGIIGYDGSLIYKSSGNFHVAKGGSGLYSIISECPDGTQTCFGNVVAVPCTCSTLLTGEAVVANICSMSIPVLDPYDMNVATYELSPITVGPVANNASFQFTCGQ